LQVSGDPMSGSADGTEVFLTAPNDSGGYVTAWYAVTDSWQTHNLGGASFLFFDDVAVARDGNLVAVNNLTGDSDFSFPMFLDSALNQVSQLGIESLFAAVNQPGMALHDSGALLYSSTDRGIDVIDEHHGTLSERIVLNEQAVGLSGSLAIDQTGGRIFLITNAGLTSIELDAVPLSIGSVTPSSGSPGTLLQIRGSGFQTGTTAKVNGKVANTTFVDAGTLQLTIPVIASGPAALTLVNSDGTSYNLDAAIVVQ
jgi:IPT/TIG domain